MFERERSFEAVSRAISGDSGVADISGYTDYGRVWLEFLEPGGRRPRPALHGDRARRRPHQRPRAARRRVRPRGRARRAHLLDEPRAEALLELRRLGDGRPTSRYCTACSSAGPPSSSRGSSNAIADLRPVAATSGSSHGIRHRLRRRHPPQGPSGRHDVRGLPDHGRRARRRARAAVQGHRLRVQLRRVRGDRKRRAAAFAALGHRPRGHGRLHARQPPGAPPLRLRRDAPRRHLLLDLQHLLAGADRVPRERRRQQRGGHREGIPRPRARGARAGGHARARRRDRRR